MFRWLRVTFWMPIALVAATDASAQAPHRDWRTLETANFRVHYPVEYEAWTLRTAEKLEAIRARVAGEVSYHPAQRVDVVVMDPVSEANGFALPLLGSPRMVLWTTPPPSGSVIGQFRSWPELLVTHEVAHLVHLLRPSRNPIARVLERTLLPLGPIVLRAPRWVIEGYATVIEGQLTGSGRPHGDLRAAILRRWAQRGRLPSYHRLSSDPERWQGMSMAYLAGSAYLEWLVDRTGPDSLRHLWARLTARTVRSFYDAFSGVFGEDPEALYGRFVAELTERAMVAERALEPHVREGDLWQRIEWSTGVPAVSPDGTGLAIVIRQRDRAARLVVWSTAPDEEQEREWRERIEKMLERDPEDVAPVRVRPLPRKPVHELPAIDGADPEAPRWMPDGGSILFVRFEADPQGFLHPDLFRWYVEPGRVERITRLGDVRQPDPSPDGTWAVAVRHRHGLSQLVRVDLADGAVTPLTEASVDVVYDSPRISPDGTRLLYLRHAGERWRAVIQGVDGGHERELETRDATVAHPAWSRDGTTVFMAVGANGFIDIHAFAADGSARPVAVTRTRGAALGPEPSSDRQLYFLSLEPHGLDLRAIRIEPAPALPEVVSSQRLVPGVPPAARETRRPGRAPVDAGRRYGIGRQEFMPVPGGLYGPSGRLFEIALRGGDLLGRLNYLGVLSLSRGEGVAEGAAFALAWRGWPVTPRAHVFGIDERPSAQPVTAPELGLLLDARRRGAEFGAEWQRQHRRRRTLRTSVGGLLAEVEPVGRGVLRQRTVFGDVAYSANPSWGDWHWQFSTALRVDRGRTGTGSWTRLRGNVHAGIGYRRSAIGFTLERRHLRGDPSAFDRIQVGGVPGSALPPSLAAARVAAPALPLGTLVGDRYERQRLDLRAFALPIFFERHRVGDQGRTGEWVRIVGTELALSTGAIPLVRLPAPVMRVGAARILDPSFENDNRWWISLSWRSSH